MYNPTFSRRILISLSIGNILEFYDFALYGFLASKLATLYFPHNDIIVSYILTFTVFSLGFISRPLGSMIFGYVGDKYGRSISMSYSLALMGLITFLIGCIPTYEQIGILAPVMLSIFRILQGICMGGEYTGSLVLLSENLPHEKYPATLAALIVSAGVSGWYIASLFTYFTTLAFVPSYAWRFGFLLGGLTGYVGFYLRRSITENPEIIQLIENNRKNKVPILSNFRESLLPLVAIMGIGCFMGVVFYGQFIFQNSFLPLVLKLERSQIQFATTIGIAFYMIFLPIMGLVSDKFGHIKIMSISAIFTLFLSYPIYYLPFTQKYQNIIVSEILSGLLLAGFMAPAMYVMPKVYSANIRYFGVSVSYNLGASIFGGSTPAISMLIYQKYLQPSYPFIYLAFASIYGIIAAYLCKKILQRNYT